MAPSSLIPATSAVPLSTEIWLHSSLAGHAANKTPAAMSLAASAAVQGPSVVAAASPSQSPDARLIHPGLWVGN